jgi:polysaccharide biosynthesis protein PslH
MRTLVVAGEYPWPQNSGSRMRLITTLHGLRRCGPTELFSIVPSARRDFGPVDEALGLIRVGRVGFDARPPHGLERLSVLPRLDVPLELPWQDGPAVTRSLLRFSRGPYDLIWMFGVRPWVLTGGTAGGPLVLDLDDLEDQKIAARLSISGAAGTGAVERAQRVAGRAVSETERRRWARLYREAGRRTAQIVVCSDADAERARANGLDRIAVVPNAYPATPRPTGSSAVGSPPTVLFAGTLRYPPNADASRYLVEEVYPELIKRIPDVRLRLVGVATPPVEALAHPPQVTVVGRVDEMESELERADLIVIPIRFGSGTRLKVIEAFAHRIPVVSTSLGAEGLHAVDGEHLLIGDSPAAMAEACEHLLTDPDLRARLSENAYQLFLDRFERNRVAEVVAGVARAIVQPVDPGEGSVRPAVHEADPTGRRS